MIRQKRTKAKQVFLWTSCIAIAMLVSVYFALDYGVNRMLQSMVSDHDRQSIVGEHSEGISTAPGDVEDIDSSTARERMEEPNWESPLPEVNESPVPSTDQNEMELDSHHEGETSREDAKSSANKLTPVEPPADDTYTGEITEEKLEKAKEEISFRERTKVASVLLSKLSASDVRRLMGMSSMTIEEKREAKKLILEKLSEEEYDELITIAAKLGLSQGKQYSESLKEFE